MSDALTIQDLKDKLNKRYGDLSCTEGAAIELDPKRLPSGVFSVDLAIGGGFPLHQISILKGPEHGGKTSLAMSFMSMVPKICWRCFNLLDECSCSLPSIKMKSWWCDAENAFNKFWASKIGCNPDDYIVSRADDGNQYGDMIKYALKADDCGLVVLDSIAALSPGKVLEASLDTNFVGAQSLLISKIMSTINNTLAREWKRGHPCLVICTNQLRAVIGVMFGPTTTMAGGYSMKYTPSYIVNVSKKSFQDKEKHYLKESDLYTAQRHSFYIEKFRSIKLTESGEFIRATADNPIQGYHRGELLDYKTTLEALSKYEILKKSVSGKYSYRNFKGSQKELIELWKRDRDKYLSAQMEVIGLAKKRVLDAEPSMSDVSPSCDNTDKTMETAS